MSLDAKRCARLVKIRGRGRPGEVLDQLQDALELLHEARLLTNHIGEAPTNRGSVNGMAAQLQYKLTEAGIE